MNKSALKRLAVELRTEAGCGTHDRFDPYQLADLYGVDVHRLSDLDCAEAALIHFRVTRPEVFSGALVPLVTGGAVIIENDAHSPERRRSTASHEMAHLALEHTFQASLADGDARRCRLTNKEQEAEAAELSGELLLPYEAAKFLAIRSVSDEEAAKRFDVSVEIAAWRLNSTGARKMAERWVKKKNSAG